MVRREGVALLVLVAMTGCRGGGAGAGHGAGAGLPVTSSRSVALPGAVDAADAPGAAPRVAEGERLTTYTDAAAGVSFRYPTVWHPPQGAMPVEPGIAAVVGAPRIVQMFTPEGNFYQPTVLRALMFSYGVRAGMSAAGCAGVPAKVVAGAGKTVGASYGGVRYAAAAGGDAGMCTQVRSWVDATMSGGRCLVFERDFVTMCPYVKTPTLPRPLTAAETAALQRHLDAVMASVRLVGGG